MDINSLFILLAVLVAIWLFIKLVVSPLLKAVIGIVIFVAAQEIGEKLKLGKQKKG